MDAPDLTAPQAALANARAVREQMRGRNPQDPERRAAVHGALGLLKDAWGPAHESYVRSGPQIGRLTSSDPVRVLRREMVAETKRLRSSLSHTSGTPRKAQYEPINATQMRGHMARFVQFARSLSAEHTVVRRRLGRGSPRAKRGGGGYFLSVHELNEEARRLLDALTDARRDLKIAWERYERHPYTHEERRKYKDVDDRERLSRQLAAAREEADVVAAEIRQSATLRKRDPPRPRLGGDRWDPERIILAVTLFRDREGRLPKKADYNRASNVALPYYTTLRRVLGLRPLAWIAKTLG